MKTKNIENRTFSRKTPVFRRITPGSDDAIEEIPRPVVTRIRDIPHDHVIDRHSHRLTQLLFASQGVMSVTTELGVWVVPPQRAVWIPAFVEHEVRARGMVRMRSLYIKPGIFPGLPEECSVVTVSPLLRELILRAIELPALYDETGPDGRMISVIIDQISTLPAAPLHLPVPTHPRLREIVSGFMENPADTRSAAELSAMAGISSRTLTRLFLTETGMSFSQWRQQVRLLEALQRLAGKEPVTSIALDLGYESQSAFITMFKKALGKTPGKYYSD